jgi:Uma2 family endonuclease
MGLNNLDANSQAQIKSLVLHWPASVQWANDQFFDFCQANKELRIERTADGDCEIMAPTGGETSWRNSRLITLLSIWAEEEGSGVVFDSSGGFILPSGAIRSPDASWVKKNRLALLTAEQKKKFLPLCPDFVIELCSPSDNIVGLQSKMQEYMANGALLGWLIESEGRQVFIYQPGKPVCHLDNPPSITAELGVRAFVLQMQKVWEPGF